MEKIWVKNYSPGVPAEINPDAYQSLVEIFLKTCRDHHSKPAFYSLGTTLTFNQLNELTRDFAAFLQNDLQMKKGDRIAIMLPNLLQYPVAMFGALRAGLIVVNINPLYTATELVYQLKNSGAITILALANFASTVEEALPKVPEVRHVIITQVGDLLSFFKKALINFVVKYIHKKVKPINIPNYISFDKALSKGANLTLNPVEFSNQDIAFLQYTGGTTGVSKGAILTHRNIISNLQQAEVWFGGLLKESQEVIITALPLYHIFSLTANCLYFSKIGGLNILISDPRNLTAAFKDIKKFKFTAISGVNTLFNSMLKHPAFTNLDFKSLRLTLGGGMPVQKVVAEKWQKVTNTPLLEAYGLTETSPCVSINPTNVQGYNGSVGLPVSSTEVCFLDEHGDEVPIGQPGELAVKGPQVMQGYWENPEETKKVFTHDGWLLTGDIGSINEQGFIYLHERKKDMILVSGFNVYPTEIEDVIARIPGVKEVAVIGVPDENSGEIVKAFVVRDNPELSEDEIKSYSRRYLTPYKVPKEVKFRKDLPKSNVGKILRRSLREKEIKPQ